MYPKTGQRGADVIQTAMLTALSLNVSPTTEGVCWRGWMWAVSDSLQDPSACQVGKAMPAYTSARSGFTPWWLTTQSRIDMVGVGILHVLLKTIYIFTVPFFELSFSTVSFFPEFSSILLLRKYLSMDYAWDSF